MHTFKTNFKANKIIVDPDDLEKLIDISYLVAKDAYNINLEKKINPYTLSANIGTVDSVNGNIYRINIDFPERAAILDPADDEAFHISFRFKYDMNDELFLYSTDIYVFNHNLFKYKPLADQYPDSTYVNFYDDFKIYSYDIHYRQCIRHYIEALEDDDEVSIVDFEYTVRNNKTTLNLSYNYHLFNCSPEESFKLSKQDLSPTDLMYDNHFFELLYSTRNNTSVTYLLPYMNINNLKISKGFKSAYMEFTNTTDKELLQSQLNIIQMNSI